MPTLYVFFRIEKYNLKKLIIGAYIIKTKFIYQMG